MTEKWLIAPGEERLIDIAAAQRLKISLVGGQVDVVAHDEPGIRIEVHRVSVKDLRVTASDGQIEIDHPQLGWDNFLEVFRNFGSGGPKAEISVAVPRSIALTLGVVSAGALVSGLRSDVRLNTVSGDLILDSHIGDATANAVSGDLQVRELTGALNANTVSGDIAATGTLRKVTIDGVSGNAWIDAAGAVNTVAVNTVSGKTTVRLDDTLAANYVVHTISGRVQVDGIDRSTSGPTNFTGSVGELAGTFADVRVNSVSGSVTVVRKSVDATTDAAPPAEAPTPEAQATAPTPESTTPTTPITEEPSA